MRWLVIPLVLVSASALAYPPHCTDPAHRQFDFWIGDWNVTKADGKPGGTSRIERILDGCVILERWSGANGFTGQSFNLWDQRDKKWHQTWVDADGDQQVYVGGLDGKVMDYRSESEEGGKRFLRHLTFTPLPDGRVRQKCERSFDGGKSWSIEYDLYYQRVGT
jgi:hypothetical protein